jgi:hypothetical protein
MVDPVLPFGKVGRRVSGVLPFNDGEKGAIVETVVPSLPDENDGGAGSLGEEDRVRVGYRASGVLPFNVGATGAGVESVGPSLPAERFSGRIWV